MSHDRSLEETGADLSPDDEAGPEREPHSAGSRSAELPPSAATEVWAWATEYGAPERASTEQLLAWLGSGELPAHVLVWKPGWGEWLPAMQVAELAAAFPAVTPGSRRVARAATLNALLPPPVPVAHYPRLRLLAKDVMSESPLPPPAAAFPGLAPAQAGRRSLRDLDRAQQDLVTSQVPAAAMLEAARAMKRPGAAPAMAQRWSRLELGTFGDAAPSSTPAPRTLSPHAIELALPARRSAALAPKPARRSSGYGTWLLFGALIGSALGLVSVPPVQRSLPTALATLLPAAPVRASEPSPRVTAPPATPAAAPAPESAPAAPAAAPAPESAPAAPARASAPVTPAATPPPAAPPSPPPESAHAQDLAPAAPPAGEKRPGVMQVKHPGEPALLNALRISEKDDRDRVVFEFREHMPGYRLEYIDQPRDCASGSLRRIAGDAWLQVRFSPASAHAEEGEPSARARELKPGLDLLRELERTCDSEGVVTWVLGAASARRFRAFELSAPPRLVVDIYR